MSITQSKKSVAWIGLCMSSAITKTIVHFYPSSGPVVAPYEILSTFTLFGEGIETQTIGIEGARLSQPDGVPLEELFQDLREPRANPLGVKVELSSTTARGRLDGSECVIELKSRGSSLKYRAKEIPSSGEEDLEYQAKTASFLSVSDKFSNSSLVGVNASSFLVSTPFLENKVKEEPQQQGEDGVSFQQGLAPFSVQEFNFSSGNETHDTRWGDLTTSVLECEMPSPEIAYFGVYKDVTTNRALSVFPL